MEQLYIPKQNYKAFVRCSTYNQSRYIEDALHGFAMQKTSFPFVCLVMDDCSTDGEQDVIKAWMEHECDMDRAEYFEIVFSNIILVPHKTNVNCTFVFYLLKQNLYGTGKKIPIITPWREHSDYEALCEGDDYWTDPTKLQKQVDWLECHPDYTAVIHNAKRVNENGTLNLYDILADDGDVTPEMTILGGGDFCSTNSIVFRSDILKTAPKEVFSQYVGDYPLQIYLTFAGKVRYFKDVMSAYRVNAEGSWSQENMKPSIKIRKPLWKKEAKLYRDMNKISGGKYAKIFREKKYESLLWDAKRCGSWYYAFIFWLKLGAPLDHLKLNYLTKFARSIVRK